MFDHSQTEFQNIKRIKANQTTDMSNWMRLVVGLVGFVE